MTLWLGIVLMTAVAVAVVLWPLRRRGTLIRSRSGFEVCRVQPADIGQDRTAGSIGKADANAVVVEASRRLLVAAESDVVTGDALARADWRRCLVATAIPILLPLGTGGLYFAFGSPGLPAQPLAARLDAGLHTRSRPAPVAQGGEPIYQSAGASIGGPVVPGIDVPPGRPERAVTLMHNPYAKGAAPLDAAADSAGGRGVFDAGDPGARFLAEFGRRSDQQAGIWSNMRAGPPLEVPFGAWVGEALSSVSASGMVDVEAPTAGRSSTGTVAGATDQQ